MYDEFFKSINFDITIVKDYEIIYVLVSGGFDSTLLYEYFKSVYPDKVVPVNCFNPYELSNTLDDIKKDPKYLEVKPSSSIDYKSILHDSFMRLNQAAKLRRDKKYHKKVFPCCKYIKHKAFFNSKLFKNPKSCVISGIRSGEGSQRRAWLSIIRNQNKWIHQHVGGQIYVYPFRDYLKHSLPEYIKDELRKTYPNVRSSGCAVCPVITLFSDRIFRIDGIDKRTVDSVLYLRRMIEKGEFEPSED